MDVAACDRRFGMPHQCRYLGLAETEGVGYTGETGAEGRGRKIVKGSGIEESVPIFGKGKQWLRLFCAGKHENAMQLGALSLQQVENREPDGSHRCAFFAVAEAKAAVLGIQLRPIQINALAAPAAG